MDDIRNQNQIIRKDARGCFVESLSDAFEICRIHFVFATYDLNRPAGQRQTNYISIYITADEFLELCRKTECVSFAICCRIRKKVEIKLHFISALEVLLQKSWQSKAALEKME